MMRKLELEAPVDGQCGLPEGHADHPPPWESGRCTRPAGHGPHGQRSSAISDADLKAWRLLSKQHDDDLFAAAARTAVPRLLDEVDSLRRARNARLNPGFSYTLSSELMKLQRVTEEASPAPWIADAHCLVLGYDGDQVADVRTGADAEFIALARWGVPCLLERIGNLCESKHELEEALKAAELRAEAAEQALADARGEKTALLGFIAGEVKP